MINLQDFINSTVNQSIDIDNAYGIQCYDLPAKWIIDNNWGTGFYCAWTGGVRDLIEHFNEISGIDKNQLEVVYNDPNNTSQIPLAGDIIVFDWNQYGHIGICIDANNNSMTTLEQNIGNGDGAGYDDRTQIVYNRAYDGTLGWVTPKKQDQEIMLKNSIKEAIEKAQYSYPERTNLIKNAVDNNNGNYIVAEMNWAWENEQKLASLSRQQSITIENFKKSLEAVSFELESLKDIHKNCKQVIKPVNTDSIVKVDTILENIKELPTKEDISSYKFSFNKFLIGLSKSGQLQIILSIVATSVTGFLLKNGFNISNQEVLTIMGSIFAIFGLNISVATNNNTK
jgi:hypothetical protein